MKTNQNNDCLTISETFQRFREILNTAERHSTVRQAVIRGICNLLNRADQLEEISRHLQPLLNEFTRDELNIIVETITTVYLNQRQQIEGGDDEIKLNGYRYRIWLYNNRPLTKIEEIILKWLGSNNPYAQQAAMQAKVEFANAIDKAEEKQIQEIRKKRGISNTYLAEIKLAKIRSFFPDKIVGILSTIGREPYLPIVGKVLPELFHQDQDKPEAVDFVLRKWKDDENSNREIATGLQLGTTSDCLGLGLKLAKNPSLWILLSSIAVGTVVYSAKASAEYIINLISQPPPPPPPCLPPQEPNKGIFVLPSANVKDIDSSNFDMGTLTVEFSNGATVADRVWIHNQSNNQGEIGIDCKNNVTYGGEVIGKVEGGDKTKLLVVTFNDKSTPDAATALLRNIQYTNTSQTPVDEKRELKIQVSDGQENGNSKSITKAINLTTENQSPIVILPTNSQTVKENSKLTIPGIEIRDSDSEKLTVTLSVNNGILTVKPKVDQELSVNKNKAIKTDTPQKIEAKTKHASEPDPAKQLTVKHDKSAKNNIAEESKDKNQQTPKPDAAQKIIIENNNTKTVVLTGTVGEINTILSEPKAITYQADKDFTGEDVLTVNINDNGKTVPGSNTKTLVYPENALKAKTAEKQKVKITVTPLKPPAVINLPGDQKGRENTEIAISGINISDPNSSPNINVNLAVNNGVLTVNNNVAKGLTTKEISNNGKPTVTLKGTLAQLNTTLADANAIIYKPNKDFSGSDNLTITVNNGSKKPAQNSVNITIKHTNQPPEITESNDITQFETAPVPSITNEQAQQLINVVNEYLQAKNRIFAPPYDREIATTVLTGKAYADKITSSKEGSQNWLQKNNAYYQYSNQNAKFLRLVSVDSQQVQMDVHIFEELAYYQPGKPVSNITNDKDYRVKLIQDNGKWKIFEIKSLKDIISNGE